MIGSGFERRDGGNEAGGTSGAKVRVYELAKELGMPHRDLVAKIKTLGIEVGNHMSNLEVADAERVKRSIDRERHQSLVEERLSDTVIRRRSSRTAGAPPVVVPPVAAPAPLVAKALPTPVSVPRQPAEPVTPPAVEPRTEARAPEPKPAVPVPSPVPVPSSAPEKATVSAPPKVEPAAPATPRPEPTPEVIVAAPVEAKREAPPAPTSPTPAPAVFSAKAPVRPGPVPVASASPSPEPATAGLARPSTPGLVFKTIPAPVVTGSAATGQFIQLPNMPPRGEPQYVIKDRDEELRRLGRTGLTPRQPLGQNRFGGRPAFGQPGQRPGGPPRKRVAAAGKKLKQTQITTPAEHKRVIRIGETVGVSELAQRMGVKGNEVIKKLWALGMMGVNINQNVDVDTATLIANEFGYQIESTAFREDEVISEGETDSPEDMVPRAPVVTIMGHVDHGKTSLLDAIRKANVAGGEAGGITQHIGAYKVHAEGGDVVFLDTPGHEAFTAMRARGARMTDIVVLVVAADDGPMPQTVEAINHAKAAEVPIVVAVNKVDKPGANPAQIRTKLMEYGLVPEEFGGDIIFIDVSAKTRQGIDKLLEMLALQADVLELRANPKKTGRGHVIEARLDRSRGAISTILVEDGTMRIGDLVVAGESSGKIRAMLGDKGQNLTEAGPATPVEVLGLDGVPDAGETFNVVTDEKSAKALVEHRRDLRKKRESSTTTRVSLENILDKIREGAVKEVKIVLKADVQGSAEAVASALRSLSNGQVGVNVISSGVGGITESDITLAKASSAVVIGFNVRPAGKSQQMAEQDGVDIKLYQVIYDALDDVKKAMVGMLSPVLREKIMGKAQVRQVYTIQRVGTIAGCFVTEGKLVRKVQVRLVRDSVVVYNGRIGSLKRFKEDASEVAQGYECGLTIDGYNDLKEGDVIEAYEVESIAATLDPATGASGHGNATHSNTSHGKR